MSWAAEDSRIRVIGSAIVGGFFGVGVTKQFVRVGSCSDETRVAVLQRRQDQCAKSSPGLGVVMTLNPTTGAQRDLAHVSELALLFRLLGLGIVNAAAVGRKWNALPVLPGLVVGHFCRADPYCVIREAQAVGGHSELSGLIISMIRRVIALSDTHVLLLNLTSQHNGADFATTSWLTSSPRSSSAKARPTGTICGSTRWRRSRSTARRRSMDRGVALTSASSYRANSPARRARPARAPFPAPTPMFTTP